MNQHLSCTELQVNQTQQANETSITWFDFQTGQYIAFASLAKVIYTSNRQVTKSHKGTTDRDQWAQSIMGKLFNINLIYTNTESEVRN
jgi:hypothetical protein